MGLEVFIGAAVVGALLRLARRAVDLAACTGVALFEDLVTGVEASMGLEVFIGAAVVGVLLRLVLRRRGPPVRSLVRKDSVKG